MKNNLKNLRETKFYKNAPKPVRWIIGSLSNNLGYKLLSLVLAVLVTYLVEKPCSRLLAKLFRAKKERQS